MYFSNWTFSFITSMLEISTKKIHYCILIIDASRLGSWFKHGFRFGQILQNLFPQQLYGWWVNKLVRYIQSTIFFSAAQHSVSWVVIYKYHCVGRGKKIPHKNVRIYTMVGRCNQVQNQLGGHDKITTKELVLAHK